MSVSLLPSQVDHVRKLLGVLRDNSFALDFSALGSGKTFTSSYIARQLGLAHIVVVSPVSVQSKWQDMKTRYGVPVRENLSFCSLRSVRDKQSRTLDDVRRELKHGLLVRRDYLENNQRKTEFEATDKFRAYLEAGVMLVVDEMQHVKNVTSQFAACQALVRAIIESGESGGRSRVLMLSGSPIDKEEQATTLMRSLHIMKQAELCHFNIGTYRMEPRGITDVVDFCDRVDPAVTQRSLVYAPYWQLGEVHMRRLCYTLFQKVIKPRFASAMPPPRLSGSLAKFNAFYRMDDPQDRRDLTAAVASLERAVGYRHDTDQVAFQGGTESMRALTAALVRVETAKINTLVRAAREALWGTHTKVVVCVNFTNTIRRLKEELAEYAPLVLDGAVPKDARKKVIDRFQEPNDTHRLLLGNCSVCSTGIDLDDKHGAFPRLALVSPNYSTITLYQLGHRFQRLDTRGAATVHMVFSQHQHELPVLNALARKGAVLRDTSSACGAAEDCAGQVLFPGEFPSWDEPAWRERVQRGLKRRKGLLPQPVLESG